MISAEEACRLCKIKSNKFNMDDEYNHFTSDNVEYSYNPASFETIMTEIEKQLTSSDKIFYITSGRLKPDVKAKFKELGYKIYERMYCDPYVEYMHRRNGLKVYGTIYTYISWSELSIPTAVLREV